MGEEEVNIQELDLLKGNTRAPDPSLDRNALMRAMIASESGGDPNAVSPAGAQGLMQIMPNTGADVAQRLGLESYDPYNPDINMQVGSAYMDELMGQFGKLQLALAAYNAGPTRMRRLVRRYGEEGALQRAPGQTRRYIQRVLERFGKV